MPSRFFLKDYFLIWLALVLMGLYFRPLTPIDETRAVSVAWEMWRRGDFLVPHLNGLPYSHKPPLLQWSIHLMWLAFGVGEWSARLVAPLYALGNLMLTAKLSRRLWPDDETSARLAPLFLLALPVWALWTSLTLYDMLATFFTLLGLLGLIRAGQGESRSGWALAGFGIGLGILAKGPAILLMILSPALLAPWWLKPKPANGWGRWYLGLSIGVLLGAAIGLAWALPAGFAGGNEYRRMIFWGQAAGRISHSFAHQRPFWWYFPLLPVIWLPWSLWPPMWRSAKTLALGSGMRFCAVQSLSVLAAFSLISGKQIHYLLPIFPAMALFAARALSFAHPTLSRRDQVPIGLLLIFIAASLLLAPMLIQGAAAGEAGEIAAKAPLSAKLMLLGLGLAVLSWRPDNPVAGIRILTVAMLGVMFSAHLGYRQVGWGYHDMQPFADRLATVEREGAPIAYWLKYHGDFNFLGHLRRPLVEIDTAQELHHWMKIHPEGYVVLVRQPNPSANEDGAEFAQFYRGTRRIMLWKAEELLARMGAFQGLLQ